MKRLQKSHLEEDTAFNSFYGETLRGSENGQNRPSVGTLPTFLNCILSPALGLGEKRLLYVWRCRNAQWPKCKCLWRPGGCHCCEYHGWRGVESICFSIITKKRHTFKPRISRKIIALAPTFICCSLSNKISDILGLSSKELAGWAAINLCFWFISQGETSAIRKPTVAVITKEHWKWQWWRITDFNIRHTVLSWKFLEEGCAV